MDSDALFTIEVCFFKRVFSGFSVERPSSDSNSQWLVDLALETPRVLVPECK